MNGTWLVAQYSYFTGYVMTMHIVGADAYGTPVPSSGGGYYSSNNYLNQAQMTVNAQYILNFLRSRGWRKNAVCGVLGNMQSESTINPGIWQGRNPNNVSGGYGLVQWTPSTKFTNWAQQNGYPIGDMVGQLERIRYEVANGLQWYSATAYPMSFSAFTTSTESGYYLPGAFLRNYERPIKYHYEQRGNQANNWFNVLT